MSRRDEIKRRGHLRKLFRGMVRAVIINKNWLMEDEEAKIGSNVNRNIALLIRPRTKTGLLTLSDKTLIRRPSYLRTVADRKRLIKLISSLTCFEQIPPKIVARLVPSIKYLLLSPGKTLMYQGFHPMAVYYVLTGEVVLSKKRNDTEEIELICGPGSSVGEDEIIEHCTRKHTAKTGGYTELLTIFEDEYRRIVLPYMYRQWEYKKKALTCFEFFKHFTEEQMYFLLKIATLKEYKPLETICSSDEGKLSTVYLVISGQCMILQCLKIKVEKKGQTKKRSLCKYGDKESNKHFEKYSHKVEVPYQVSDNSIHQAVDDDLEDVINIFNKNAYKKYISPCGIKLREVKQPDDNNQNEDSRSEHTDSNVSVKVNVHSNVMASNKSYIGFAPSIKKLNQTEITYEMHFVDVGSFNSGSVFGLGEKMEDRAIMARTTVQLLLIPRYWLLDQKQNIGNQWEKFRFSLNEIIPSRKLLFDDYIATFNWERYKKNFSNELIDMGRKTTNTKNEDIPIICRILESQLN